MLRTFTGIMTAITKRVPIPAKGVDYRGKVVLAPMVRSGECPSRLLALKYGADLVWGPETIDKAMIGTTKHFNPNTKTIDFTRMPSNKVYDPDASESVIYRLDPERESKKLIYQIGTSNPETAVEASKLVAEHVAGIDVNAGCPKPFSTTGGMGAALLRTPEKLCSILEALVKEVGNPFEIGISVKIRLLETPEMTKDLVTRLCATGITGLTIHCRTTPMRPRERAIREQLRMITETCHEAGVACLMNGDVTSRDEAMQLANEYGADGGMIATAAETNPSCFRAEADGGKAPWEEVVAEYMRICLEVENRFGNTKYLLGQMIPGKSPKYKVMNQSKSYADLARMLEMEQELGERAKEVDHALGIGKPAMSKAEKKAKNKAMLAKMAEEKEKLKADGQTQEEVKTSLKRTADEAALDNMPADIARKEGPGSVTDHNASVLAV